MGRFDALTKLDDNQLYPSMAAIPTTPKQPQTQPQTNQPDKIKNHEVMKTRNHEDKPTPDGLTEKPDKYSTLLDSSLVKKIKIYSAEKEIKDYQVIAQALTEFFERNN